MRIRMRRNVVQCSRHHQDSVDLHTITLVAVLVSWIFLCLTHVVMSSNLMEQQQQQQQYAPNLGQGYYVSSIKQYPNHEGFEATLEVILPHSSSSSGNADDSLYGANLNPLRLIVRSEEKGNRVHVYISDYYNSRWEVPQSIIPRPKATDNIRNSLMGTTAAAADHKEIKHEKLLAVTYTTHPFGFAITRISNGEVLFNSTPAAAAAAAAAEHDTAAPADDASSSSSSSSFNPMVFKDQYLEISTQLPVTASLFGLGESTRPDGLQLKQGRTYTLWTTDITAMHVNVDLYGAYPFYMDVREATAAAGQQQQLTHGVLLLNSNAMEVSYGEECLTFRVTGGVLDFYFFPGPSPLAVLDQYTQLVGRPAPMPYWSFGFHQCRWGYRNVSTDRSVVANFKKARIPLDTMWNDIDYAASGDRDFTNDPIRFALTDWRSFVEELHANGQHYVILIDPGISIAYEDYGTYERGLKADIFLKNPKGENYLAQVWPGPVYFPDFLNPKTTEWWTNEVQMFHDKIPIDGMWIDMNEVSNFCTGTFCSWNGTLFEDSDQCYLNCSSTVTKWDDPPFKINHAGTYQELGYKTAAMTVKHHDGSLEYNAHSLYGIAESIATNIALTKVRKKRPFLLSRSTFIGSGAHTAHWTGDDGASFEDLAYSIVTILNSGIFGVPMVGADICGFYGTPTEDLCGRWIQTGAFYPFSRAHNVRNNPGKEFYRWKSVTKSARKALGLRYRLLPYFYTLNFEAHTTGAPIARPLFFSFPDDPEALKINYQFLIGSSILVSPVVQANTTSVHAYFPKGTWYNLYDWSSIISTGSSFIVQAPWDVINVHVYEGSIIPMQESLLTSALVRKSLFTLVVAFPAAASNCESSSSSATGHLFLDDGDDIKMELTDGKSTHVLFNANLEAAGNGFVKSQVVYGEYALKENWVVQTVVILGVRIKPNTVLIHQEARAAEAHVKVTHAGEVPSLHLSGLNLLMGKGFEITWMPK